MTDKINNINALRSAQASQPGTQIATAGGASQDVTGGTSVMPAKAPTDYGQVGGGGSMAATSTPGEQLNALLTAKLDSSAQEVVNNVETAKLDNKPKEVSPWFTAASIGIPTALSFVPLVGTGLAAASGFAFNVAEQKMRNPDKDWNELNYGVAAAVGAASMIPGGGIMGSVGTKVATKVLGDTAVKAVVNGTANLGTRVAVNAVQKATVGGLSGGTGAALIEGTRQVTENDYDLGKFVGATAIGTGTGTVVAGGLGGAGGIKKGPNPLNYGTKDARGFNPVADAAETGVTKAGKAIAGVPDAAKKAVNNTGKTLESWGSKMQGKGDPNQYKAPIGPERAPQQHSLPAGPAQPVNVNSNQYSLPAGPARPVNVNKTQYQQPIGPQPAQPPVPGTNISTPTNQPQAMAGNGNTGGGLTPNKDLRIIESDVEYARLVELSKQNSVPAPVANTGNDWATNGMRKTRSSALQTPEAQAPVAPSGNDWATNGMRKKRSSALQTSEPQTPVTPSGNDWATNGMRKKRSSALQTPEAQAPLVNTPEAGSGFSRIRTRSSAKQISEVPTNNTSKPETLANGWLVRDGKAYHPDEFQNVLAKEAEAAGKLINNKPPAPANQPVAQPPVVNATPQSSPTSLPATPSGAPRFEMQSATGQPTTVITKAPDIKSAPKAPSVPSSKTMPAANHVYKGIDSLEKHGISALPNGNNKPQFAVNKEGKYFEFDYHGWLHRRPEFKLKEVKNPSESLIQQAEALRNSQMVL
jgi:hypothetical protein